MNNITATSFGIYVFALKNNNPLGANGLINITFGTALPTGTFAFAFGEDVYNSKVYDTPFTESGLTGLNVTTQSLAAVPEPASLILLGSGLLFAGRNFRKNRQMQKSRELKSSKTKTSSNLEGELAINPIA